MILLWHDDCRKPPTGGWTWARTNNEAKNILKTGRVDACSLDHDLGGELLNPNDLSTMYHKGDSSETGHDLVKWMVENELVPREVVIHSWNPAGAKNMAATLRSGSDARVIVQPFQMTDYMKKAMLA